MHVFPNFGGGGGVGGVFNCHSSFSLITHAAYLRLSAGREAGARVVVEATPSGLINFHTC